MLGSAISDRENRPGPSLTHIHCPLRSLANSVLMTTLTIRLPDNLKGDLNKAKPQGEQNRERHRL